MILLVRLKNDAELEANVAALRKAAKLMGVRIRTYGRCHDKVEAFKQTGRGHSHQSNANSIYSIKSPEAKFCYEWVIYRTETKEELAEARRIWLERLKVSDPDIFHKYYEQTHPELFAT